jgi:hypothetical protein
MFISINELTPSNRLRLTTMMVSYLIRNLHFYGTRNKSLVDFVTQINHIYVPFLYRFFDALLCQTASILPMFRAKLCIFLCLLLATCITRSIPLDLITVTVNTYHNPAITHNFMCKRLFKFIKEL